MTPLKFVPSNGAVFSSVVSDPTSYLGFRVNTQSNLNLFYYPCNSSETNAKCIGITSKSLDSREIMTFYVEDSIRLFPGTYESHFADYFDTTVSVGDNLHESKLHKRDIPVKDKHFHILFGAHSERDEFSKYDEQLRIFRRHKYKETNLDSFLKKLLEQSSLSKEIKDQYYGQLAISSHYLSVYPLEPGLIFEDGSYVQNGGCNDMNNPELDVNYERGPYRLFKRGNLSSST